MNARGATSTYAIRTVAVATSQVAAVVVGAVVWPLLARRLGPTNFGYFQSAQVVGGLLGYVVFFGLAQYSVWRYSTALGSWSVAAHLLRVRLVNVLLALLLLAPLAGLVHLLGIASVPVWVALVLLGNLVRQAWPDWIFISSGGAWVLPAVAIVSGSVNVAGILVLVTSEQDVLGAALSYLGASTLGLVALVRLGKRVSREDRGTPSSSWRLEMRGAVPYGFGVFAGQVVAYGDVVLLNLFGLAAEVGTYSAAYRVVLVFQGFAGAVQSVALVAFSRVSARVQAADGHHGFFLVTTVASGIFTLIAVVLVVFGRPLTEAVFGAEYSESADYLRALAILLPVDVVAALALAWLSAHGRARTAASCLVGGAVFGLGATAVLIPPFGPWGALVGKLAAVVLVCVLAARQLERAKRDIVLLAGVCAPIVVVGSALGASSWLG